ncbi:helix-turn-helix domain-containing protein [Anaerostipes faecalis]|uniref:helix-turn-helix domain-containing protein n=1 Tax=Anaerostipes faecalis TaxID=2738446 RepID=UPI003EFEDC00
MKKQTLGMMISSLRKEKGMTQLQLAEVMGVTDKAVSKWERDLSAPDVNSIPKLAETFGITVDELMQVKTETKENINHDKIDEIIDTALKGIGVAMGIAVTVLALKLKVR